jgi:hypothetical protein
VGAKSHHLVGTFLRRPRKDRRISYISHKSGENGGYHRPKIVSDQPPEG